MTVVDEKQLDRTAQFLYVQHKAGNGSPPNYPSKWKDVYAAKVESITDNMNAAPTEAIFWFPALHWNDNPGLTQGDKIRILAPDGTVVFDGFMVRTSRQFSGGNEHGGKYERLAYICLDHRWLWIATSPVYGQYGRSPDDYSNYGKSSQSPRTGYYTAFTGRRCIFNADGLPNADNDMLNITGKTSSYQVRLFCNSSPDAHAWTAGEMIQYLIATSYTWNYFSITDPSELTGLDDKDWEAVLLNVAVEGLNTATAMQHICQQIGWSYRLDYTDGDPELVFFKSGSSSGAAIAHELYAPPPADSPNDDIRDAVEKGKKMLWASQYEQDITTTVNNLFFMGSPHKFEFTAELVPAWDDDEFAPDTSDDYASLYFYESELSDLDNPNLLTFFKDYHARGSSFKRHVGRLWALNESGRYTNDLDRGMPFDFAEVLPAKYIYDVNGRRIFGPYDRQLLPCLTMAKHSSDSVGIIVEFSFNGGQTWQQLSCSIVSLKDQCGIYITEPNLAEIKPEGDAVIDEGDLEDIELNFFTSLSDDKHNGRDFKDDEWNTRVRVTASVQLDQRLGGQVTPLHSGSPFWQRDLIDASGDYHFQQRIEDGEYGTSIFANKDITPDNRLESDARNDYVAFKEYATSIRDSLQDMSISGQFTLDRLWLNTFKPGDYITQIAGRDYKFKTGLGKSRLYPEIVQVIHLVQKQKTKLITRDLRFSEKR